jgi:tetratricopeptide (TPR) repeat protein
LKPAGNLLAYENLGSVLVKTGNEDAAIQTFLAALRIDPSAAGVLYQLGSLHLRNERVEQALPLLEKAVALRPASAPDRTNLGYAYQRLGRFDDAFAQYRVLARIYPKNVMGHADAWLRMARVRARQGQKTEAAQLLKNALAAGGPVIAKAAADEPLLKELLPPEASQTP